VPACARRFERRKARVARQAEVDARGAQQRVAQQRVDDVDVPVRGRPVQRGAPSQIVRVHVGAAREQELRGLEAAAHSGKNQRRTEPSLAVDVLPRGVAGGVEQQAHRRGAAAAGCPAERERAAG
jgi:hypothetical protein